MVVKGKFSVQLVEASSGEGKPFTEHIQSKDGKCYVEAEPDAEYFIRVQILNNSTAYKDSCLVATTFEVDGVDLGYCSFSSADGKIRDNGLWKRKGGQEITTALRFEKPSAVERSSSGYSGTRILMGNVIVRFWTAVAEGKTKIVDSRDIMFSSPKCSAFQDLRKKPLLTGIGTISKKERLRGTGKYQYTYRAGILLETVQIHYCSALGLIYAGILPKPPLWEQAKKDFPMKRPIDPKLANIKPKRLKIDAVEQHGVRLEGKECDLFDLTHISSDDEDDSDSDDNILLANSNNKSHPGSRNIRPVVVLSRYP